MKLSGKTQFLIPAEPISSRSSLSPPHAAGEEPDSLLLHHKYITIQISLRLCSFV